MKTKYEGNELAFPHTELDSYSGTPCNQHFGLTKRELFAAMAMQGILASETSSYNYGGANECLAENAVKKADALINELNKE